METDNSQSSSKYIRTTKNGGVFELILARPKEYNKMDDDFFEAFESAVLQADHDPDVRVILIWAEGKIFTAGLDLIKVGPALASDEGNIESKVELYKLIKRWQQSFSYLQITLKPVICAINGKCIGGGVDLITAADIRFCTADASFTIAETRLAIVADLGTLQRITRIVGRPNARELAFTSQYVDSKRAHSMGLVNHVYPDQESMLTAARNMAQEIASLSPLVVQATKKILQYSEDHTEQEGLEYVQLWNSAFLKSPDLEEAVKAYVEKRKPVFSSKL